ncbi:MAG: FtsX-like permease family protein [Chloroflexota bacterium]
MPPTNASSQNVTLFNAAYLALYYLRQHRLRTLLTTLAIVFGVTVVFGANVGVPSVEAALKRIVGGPGSADLRIQAVTGEAFAPESILAQVAKVDGVKAATGVLRRKFTLPSLGKNAPEIEMVGIDPIAALTVSNYPVSAGQFLQPGEHGNTVIPASIAELASIKVGATLPLLTTGGFKIYTVIGLLADRGITTTPQLIVTLEDAQAAFSLPGKINAIDIALQPGADRQAVLSKIVQALGKGFQASDEASSGADISFAYITFNLFGAMALFIGGFLIFNTFRTVVVERQHEIATLRAIGAEREQILVMVLIESLIQGMLGTFLGLLGGLILASQIENIATALLVTTPVTQTEPISLVITPNAVLGSLALGIITTLIAGYLPARSASRVLPLAAVRPVSNDTVQRTSRLSLIAGVVSLLVAIILLLNGESSAGIGALIFLLGMVLLTPTLILPATRLLSPLLNLIFARESDIARGNIISQPGRTAITVNTLMIGVAVLVATSAMVVSMNGALTNILNAALANDSSDYLLLPISAQDTDPHVGSTFGVDSSLVTRLRDLPQIDSVVSIRNADAQIDEATIPLAAIDPATFTKIRKLPIMEPDPTAAYSALGTGHTAFINSYTAKTFNLSLGKAMTLQTPQGAQQYRIVAILQDLGTAAGPYAVISQATLATDFGKTEDSLVELKLRSGNDPTAARAAIETIAADYPQFKLVATADFTKTGIAGARDITAIFYALAAIVLFPSTLGLINTLTISVLERKREIGVLRALGTDRDMVRRIVMAEALLLGLIGALVGVVAGVAISSSFVSIFSAAAAGGIDYIFPTEGVIAGIVVGVLLALLASLLPARNAARLDIVQALNYE